MEKRTDLEGSTAPCSRMVACRLPSVAGMVVLLSCLLLPTHAAERHNILFLFADDFGRIANIYGAVDGKGTYNDVVATPNLDRLAREGVVFRNAFVSSPSCTPCRSALLSGQHFWRTGRGAILIGAVWDDRIPTFPLLLKGNGYHIGKMYKVWSPGTPADQPYGGQQHAFEKAGRGFNQFSQNVTKAVADGVPLTAAKQKFYDEVAANFDAFLAARPLAADKPAPFCFWFGPTNVHRKWTRGSGKALWDLDPDKLKGLLPPFLPDVPEVREDFADYLGEVMAFDHAIGVLLARLERTGELDNTLVVVSGDHGPPGFTDGKCNLYDFGARVPLIMRGAGTIGGRVIDDPVSLPDLAPTFLELGGVPVPAVMTATSLLPALRSHTSGTVDPARDHVLIGRERHVDNARAGLLPYPQRAIRTRDHLYIINFAPERTPLGDPVNLEAGRSPSWQSLVDDTFITHGDMDSGPTKAWLVLNRESDLGRPFYERAFAKRPREELYVLAADPHQMRNVAQEPRYAGIRTALEQRLLTALRATGDPRLVDNGRLFETSPFTDPRNRKP
jgi:N-sulfoglucosamine sulfohydrolase